LTPAGLKRLQEAIQAVEITENKGDRFTLEQLGDRIKISTKTLSRLWSLNSSIEQKTLKLCFSAFNLELRKEDYITLSEPDESDASEPLALPSNEELNHSPQTYSTESVTEKPHNELQLSLSYPDGPVPLNSPFYIERPPLEALAYREVTQPGCVIRIQAAKQMGKSSLILRLLSYAETQEYYTANLDCNQIDSSCLTDFNKFLRGFCLHVARELGVDPDLDDYWDEEIGSKLSCSFYFKNHLLEAIDSPVVLVVNEIDRLFEYPQLSQEFFPLLRSWYEEARRDVNLQKLRLVVVYSTEGYIALDINRSPFNIGLPLHLPEFTQPQVQDLAKRHGLDWSSGEEVAALMELVGGHPFLIRIALYHICAQGLSLNQLLQEAIAPSAGYANAHGGIFHNHLWSKWITLQKNPDLAAAMATVVTAQQSVLLDPIQAYKLESQGLIHQEGDRIKPRCELYRAYFKQQLKIRV
jgi:transcriptional regulator with XRE-family HTH domain